MAPPPTAASADPVDAEPLEVRCAGCGETLEVDRGLTEFICPDCATPQSLPPELMPTPPPRRKALPLPRGAADVRGARLPCGACGALLTVPVGLPRCACPLCGAELAVDTARLRRYLLSSAAEAVPVLPLGASSSMPPVRQARQAHTEYPDQFIPEQVESEYPDYTIGGEDIHGLPKDTGRYQEQRNIYSGRSSIVCAEKRHGEPISQVRHRAQELTSSHAVHSKQSYQQNPDRVIEALQDSVNSALFRESGCVARTNNIILTDVNVTAGRSISPKTVNVERRNMQTTKQITEKSQKKLSCYVTSQEHVQAESANGKFHVQERHQEPGSEASHREGACTQLVNGNIAGNNNRGRTRQLIGLNGMGSEKRQEQTTDDATQEVRREHLDSVIPREMGKTNVELEQTGSHRVHTGKRKSLIASSNSGLQLRRSKRLTKDSSAATDRQLIVDTELIHRQTAGLQAASPNGFMPISIIDAESEPDEQRAVSPVQSSSDLSDSDRITDDTCNSSLPSHEIPQTSYNELENLHMTMLPSSNPDMFDAEHFSSNLDMSDPEQFARTYIPSDVRRALAKLESKSLLHHMMSQQGSGEAYLHDSMDSEGQELQLASQKKGRRPRGLTLCLKVWTMPKGMHIPVSLNTLGQPIGKEAATLSNFLGTLARDGILAPLTNQNWKLVPEKNKDVMCHIVKLKFDIAPVAKRWIVKNLAKKWRTWKFHLKQQHFDTHETEEERLADRNPRVLEEHWQFLVAYWSTEKAQALSAKNKACQAKVTTYQTSGTKSFARRIEEEKQKRLNKDEPTVEDLFILTHTPKDGRPMTKAAADAIARRLNELSQKQSEGSGSGLEYFPKGQRRRGKAALKASLEQALEAKKKAEDEAAAMREKLIAMEETQKKLQKGKTNMKSADNPRKKTLRSWRN